MLNIEIRKMSDLDVSRIDERIEALMAKYKKEVQEVDSRYKSMQR